MSNIKSTSNKQGVETAQEASKVTSPKARRVRRSQFRCRSNQIRANIREMVFIKCLAARR